MEVLYQFKKYVGMPFRPSNGTEGDIFAAAYCANCVHQDPPCEVFGRTLAYDMDDEEYPDEWIFDNEGWPTCTKFESPNESKDSPIGDE